MIFCRPVTQRAILMAFSLASAPPLVKNALVKFPGVISYKSRPNSARTLVVEVVGAT